MMINMKKIKIKSVLKTVVPVTATAIVGSVFQMIGSNKFDTLEKPFLTPPKWMFPVVWTILYIILMVSGYIYDVKTCEEHKEDNARAMSLYYIGLFLNGFWTLFFFTLNMHVFASIWLAVLYLVVSSNLMAFKKYSKISAYILIPYLVWLLIAEYLNVGIILLN